MKQAKEVKADLLYKMPKQTIDDFIKGVEQILDSFGAERILEEEEEETDYKVKVYRFPTQEACAFCRYDNPLSFETETGTIEPNCLIGYIVMSQELQSQIVTRFERAGYLTPPVVSPKLLH